MWNTCSTWDDFDRFVGTITGRETLHNTIVITYQTVTEDESMDPEPDDDVNLSSEEEEETFMKKKQVLQEKL